MSLNGHLTTITLLTTQVVILMGGGLSRRVDSSPNFFCYDCDTLFRDTTICPHCHGDVVEQDYSSAGASVATTPQVQGYDQAQISFAERCMCVLLKLVRVQHTFTLNGA